MRSQVKGFFAENWGYKLVALSITLILWLTVLSRRDFVLSKDIDLDLQLGPTLSLVSQSADKIRVRVSGSRQLLKRFKEDSQVMILDISELPDGVHDVDIPVQKIDIPQGLKLLSVKPNRIRVEIQRQDPSQ